MCVRVSGERECVLNVSVCVCLCECKCVGACVNANV